MPSRVVKTKNSRGKEFGSLRKVLSTILLIPIAIITISQTINTFYPLYLSVQTKQVYINDPKNRVSPTTQQSQTINYLSPTQRIVITKTPNQRLSALPPLYPNVIWHQQEPSTNSFYATQTDQMPPMNYYASDTTSISYSQFRNYYYEKLKEPEWRVVNGADAPTTDEGTLVFENDNLVFIIEGRLVSKNPELYVHSIWHN